MRCDSTHYRRRVGRIALLIAIAAAASVTAPSHPPQISIGASSRQTNIEPAAHSPAAIERPASAISDIAWQQPPPRRDGLATKKHSSEPFSVATEDAGLGELSLKWDSVRRQIAVEKQVLALCSGQPDQCPSSGARRFLAITKAVTGKRGLALVGNINRAVNLAIRPMSDLAQYGVEDYWASPFEALGHAAGDCEDYAIAKYALLFAAGVPEKDMRLLIVRNRGLTEDHAVLSVHIDGHWRILDNRRLVMLEDGDDTTYQPLFILGDHVARVTGYGPSSMALNEGKAIRPNPGMLEPDRRPL